MHTSDGCCNVERVRLGFSLCRSDNVSNRDLYNRDMMNPDSQKEGGQHGLDRVELVDAVDLVS